MHVYETLTLEAISDFTELPKLKFHTIECPQCRLRHPVPLEYTDWKEVAQRYETAYKGMSQAFLKFLKEAAEQFDVPLEEYFEVDRELLIVQLKAIINERAG